MIRDARTGSRLAFDELVDTYEPELRRFLQRRVGKGEVDDLVQETWVAAWGSIRSFDGRCRLRTWLFGIALFKVRDHYRNRGRAFVEIPREKLDHRLRYEEPSFAGTELKESIQGLLRELSDSQREVLELYYYAELNLPEIAQVLNRNLNTVKYQFYRAHAQVAAAMGSPGAWLNGGIE